MTTTVQPMRPQLLAPAALAMAITLTFACLSVPAHAADSDAEAFIQQAADDAMAVINDDSLSHSAKKDKIGDIVDEYVDVEAIANYALGRHRRSASAAELSEFHDLFREYITNYYVENLSSLEGATLKVTGSRTLGGNQGTIVSSVAKAEGTEETEIDWRVRDGQIIDVKVASFWMALSLREQLDDVISRNGGKVSAAIDRLREMAEGG